MKLRVFLGDVELLTHVDTVEELTDILPLHRGRLLDARRYYACNSTKTNRMGRNGSKLDWVRHDKVTTRRICVDLWKYRLHHGISEEQLLAENLLRFAQNKMSIWVSMGTLQ